MEPYANRRDILDIVESQPYDKTVAMFKASVLEQMSKGALDEVMAEAMLFKAIAHQEFEFAQGIAMAMEEYKTIKTQQTIQSCVVKEMRWWERLFRRI